MEEIHSRLRETKIYIEGIVKDFHPKIGMILGSGLGHFGEKINLINKIPYNEIPEFPECTVKGHIGNLIFGEHASKQLLIMQGRFHYYEGLSMHQVAYPIWLMNKLGIEVLVITNAAGGVNPYYKAGDLMIITDHINLMGNNPAIGNPLGITENYFFDMTEAYNNDLISKIKQAGENQNIFLQQGVYAGMTGPAYETPAEVRMLKTLGADAVGMSTVPEVLAANQIGIRCCGISLITNLAAGISPEKLDHKEVIETSKNRQKAFSELLLELITLI